MSWIARSLPSLERQLLRKAMGAHAAASRRCADCGRTPLVGEQIYIYEGGRMACELCKPLRREEPARSELVHGPEHGHAVRVRVHVAA
jgi:hypothetical protein